MRSGFLGVIAVAALALALGACGDQAERSAGSRDSAPISLMLFGDAVETAGYQAMIKAFEATDPGFTVTLTPVADQDELLAKLSTGFAGGSPPDTFLINYRKYGQFAGRGALEPVQFYLDGSEALSEEDFAETAMEAFRFDGENLTCMPQNVSSLAVYFNVDLFDRAGVPAPEAGWTWDDFLAAAKKLTTNGQYGVGVEPSLIRAAPFVWSAGGEVVDDPLQPTTLTVDTGAGRRGLDFFLDLRLKHGVVPPEREELSLDAETRFLQGGLGMLLDSRKAVPTLRTIKGFEWDVAPLPVAPGGKPATILHGDAYCMTKASQDKNNVWRFIEFAMSEQGQTILAKSGRTVPSRRDVAESPAFLEPQQPPASSKVFTDVIPTIRSVPHTETWSQVEKEADNLLGSIFYGRVERDAGIRQLVEQTRPLFGAK